MVGDGFSSNELLRRSQPIIIGEWIGTCIYYMHLLHTTTVLVQYTSNNEEQIKKNSEMSNSGQQKIEK